MIQIKIKNSISLIENLSSKNFNELNQILSYKIPGSYFSNLPKYLQVTYLMKKIDSNQNGCIVEFPTGLIHYIEKYCNDNSLQFLIIDQRIKPKEKSKVPLLKNFPELRFYQKEIVEKCLKEERGIIESATGTGKSLIILKLLRELSQNSLVIVPSKQILYQFHEQLIKYFGKKNVGIVGDGKKDFDKKFVVGTVQSCESITDDQWKNIDVVIIDEFHHSAASTFQKLNENQFRNAYYRFGFTGTNFRNDGTDLALEAVLSNTIYKYDATDGIKDGFLCPPIFCLYNIEHSIQRMYKTWQKEHKDLVVNNSTLNEKIANITVEMVNKDLSTIVFVNTIEQGQNIANLISGIEYEFINGEQQASLNSEAIQRFNQGKLKCLIGTKVIGEGVDTIKAACGILADGGKAKSDIIQKIGRLMRMHESKQFSLFIDFFHIGGNWVSKHSKIRNSIYKKYNTQILVK